MSSIPQSETKRCSKCQQVKPLSEFHKNSQSKDGLASRCKSCISAYQKRYRKKNAAHIKEYKAKHYRENRDRIQARHRRYRQENAQTYICEECGNEYRVMPYRVEKLGRKYCSTECYNIARRQYDFDDTFFSQVDTEAKAYWLGFIAADGAIIDNRYLAVLLQAGDDEHLKKLRQALKGTSPLHYREGEGHPKVGVNFHSSQLVTDLSKYGVVPNKTHTIRPVQLGSALQRHYWRGVVDGDGWISTRTGGWVGLAGNPYMVRGFRAFLGETLGYGRVKISYRTERGSGRSCQVLYGGAHKVANICELLYQGVTVYLDRKYKAAKELIENKPETKEPWRNFPLSVARKVIEDYQTGQYTYKDLAAKHNLGFGSICNIMQGNGRYAVLHNND